MGPRKTPAKWRCSPGRVSVIGDFTVLDKISDRLRPLRASEMQNTQQIYSQYF